MKTLFILLKIIVALSGVIGMYFTSHFWIGTEQQWTKEINDDFWGFYFSRLLFTLIVGGLFFLLGILLNWAFRKKVEYKRKIVLIEITEIVLVAIIMTSIAVLK